MPEESPLSRRRFVVGAATLAGLAAVSPGTAIAAARSAPEVDLCAGVAVVGDHPQALCRQNGRWVLVGEDGAARATTGLDGALVLDVATDARGALAAGSVDGVPAVWASADGVVWREAARLAASGAFTAVAAGTSDAMALGSSLSEEGVPTGVIALRRRGVAWTPEAVTGLDAHHAVTTLAVGRAGWLAGSVGADSTTVHVSADGTAWSTVADGRIDDAAIQGLLDDGAVHWVGNTIGGAGAVKGTVGGGRAQAGVSDLAHAVGLVRTQRGRVSFWLLDGKLITAEVR